MNPLPMVLADLRGLRWIAPAVAILIAVAVAVGVAMAGQERTIRKGSAQAAEGFDLLIAAPGSQTQVVLTAVYLQLEALPLLDGTLLTRLSQDSRVAGVAPIAFGDVVRSYPVIGTTAAFVSRWGQTPLTDGRNIEMTGDAVVGAEVQLAIGDRITPAHGTAGRFRPGEDGDDEAEHRHAGVEYKVVGRRARLGTPWDHAILVPVESVWETHGLGNGHAREGAPLGHPFDADRVPGVPVIVLKPQSVASAYALRAQYRQGGTMALFPAEVLVSLYQVMSDARDVLVMASALNTILIFAATLLLVIALTGLRRRRYGILRALGAPPLYIFLVVWMGAAGLIAAGCVLGLALGWGSGWVLSGFLEQRTGVRLVFAPAPEDLTFMAALIGFGSLLASLPALMSYRFPIAQALRG